MTFGLASDLKLTIEKSPDVFGLLFDELDRFVEANALDPKCSFALRLVVEEIVLNLISYTKEGQRTNEIRLFLSARPEDVTLAIEDDGLPFDPRIAPPVHLPESLNEAVPGGVGLHLVRSMVDELSYDSSDGCNRLEVRIGRSAIRQEA